LVRPVATGREPRFNMLETLRQYALERLAESGEAGELRRRHAEYFLTQVETAEPYLDGPDQAIWLQQLEQEYDNLHAVLAWSLTVPDEQAIGLRMVASLHHFWALSNHFHEGITWTERLLHSSQTAYPALRAKALLRIGEIADWSNDRVIQATGWLEQAVALYRQIEDPAGMADALMQLGRCKYWQAAYTESQPLLEESLALFQAYGNTSQILWAYLSLGDCSFYSNQMLRARHYFQQALQLSEQQGPFGHAWALTCLGRVAHALGDTRQARIYYAESLALFRTIGERHQAPVLLELGRVAQTEGRTSAAFETYTESLMLFYGSTSRMRIPECLEGIASLVAASQPARAAQLLGAAAATRDAAGVPLSPIYRAAYEHTIAATHATLSPEAFDAAFAAGQALTLEQALDLVWAVADTAAERQ
jgi:tetratricopeptide (TPR) repeat protein